MHATLLDGEGKTRNTVHVAAFAYDDDEGLVLLELVGVDVANRRVWANLVKHRPERNLTTTSVSVTVAGVTQPVKVIPSTSYYKVESSGHLILLHGGFSTFHLTHFFGGDADEPSPWFAAAMQRLPLPILPHWLPVLWRAGIDQRLVTQPTQVFAPINVWRFNDDASSWTTIITQGVTARKLKEQAQ